MKGDILSISLNFKNVEKGGGGIQALCYILLIPVTRKQGQANFCEFQANLVYVGSLRTVRAK